MGRPSCDRLPRLAQRTTHGLPKSWRQGVRQALVDVGARGADDLPALRLLAVDLGALNAEKVPDEERLLVHVFVLLAWLGGAADHDLLRRIILGNDSRCITKQSAVVALRGSPAARAMRSDLLQALSNMCLPAHTRYLAIDVLGSLLNTEHGICDQEIGNVLVDAGQRLSEDIRVRVAAVHAMAKLSGGRDLVPATWEKAGLLLLGDRDPRLRHAATHYLAAIGSLASVPSLLHVMDGDDGVAEHFLRVSEAAEEAIRSIRKRCEAATQDRIVGRTERGDVRLRSRRQVPYLGFPSGLLPQLIGGCPWLRCRTWIRSGRAVELRCLSRCRASMMPPWARLEVKRCVSIVEAAGARHVKDLRDLLLLDSERGAEPFADALDKLHAATVLQAWLGDSSDHAFLGEVMGGARVWFAIREMMAYWLQDTPAPKALRGQMLCLLEDPDAAADARYIAVKVLGSLVGEPDVQVADLLLAAARCVGEHEHVRGAALESLAPLRFWADDNRAPAEAVARGLLNDPRAEVRYNAAYLLGEIGGQDSLSALQRVADADGGSTADFKMIADEALRAAAAIRCRLPDQW